MSAESLTLLVLFLAVGLVNLWLFHKKKYLQLLVQDLEKRLADRVHSADLQFQMSDLQEKHDLVNFEANKILAEYEREKLRADQLFSSIEGILGERDQWSTLYHRMSASNDVAQAMMMREIERLAKIYKRDTGKDVPLDQTIAQVREAWAGEHAKA